MEHNFRDTCQNTRTAGVGSAHSAAPRRSGNTPIHRSNPPWWGAASVRRGRLLEYRSRAGRRKRHGQSSRCGCFGSKDLGHGRPIVSPQTAGPSVLPDWSKPAGRKVRARNGRDIPKASPQPELWLRCQETASSAAAWQRGSRDLHRFQRNEPMREASAEGLIVPASSLSRRKGHSARIKTQGDRASRPRPSSWLEVLGSGAMSGTPRAWAGPNEAPKNLRCVIAISQTIKHPNGALSSPIQGSEQNPANGCSLDGVRSRRSAPEGRSPSVPCGIPGRWAGHRARERRLEC